MIPALPIHHDFEIKSRKDIRKMQQNLLDVDIEEQFIALEFAENMISNKQKGEIYVNGVEVISKVKGKEHIKKVTRIVEEAKRFIKGECGDASPNGRGLITILYSGWDIAVNECPIGFEITASKINH